MGTHGDSSLGRFQKGFEDINIYTKQNKDSEYISRIIPLLWNPGFIFQMILNLELSATKTLPFLCLPVMRIELSYAGQSASRHQLMFLGDGAGLTDFSHIFPMKIISGSALTQIPC